jgi:hypothetical protein
MLEILIIVDIDFSQNFVYTDRIHAIQSDHWKSSSTTIFVAVVRYLCYESWNRPPIALKKGQSVSIVKDTDDGGGRVFFFLIKHLTVRAFACDILL